MLPVKQERVNELLTGLAKFTDSKQGVTRLAYSPLDKEAQSWLLEQVQDLGLSLREDAVGKTIRMPVNSGDQITRKRLNGNGLSNAFVNSIPKDKRAVTFSVDDISGVAGFIRPATHIDVVAIQAPNNGMPSVGRLVLQNVLVLAVGSTDMNSANSSKKNEQARTITLALDPREAVQLRMAQQEGKVSFMLRPNNPTEEEFYGATVVGSGAMPRPAPVAGSEGGAVRPSANHGVTVIRGTNISR